MSEHSHALTVTTSAGPADWPDLARLDPSEPAPPIRVRYDPDADQVGHGRTLPLIGGSRNYLYDVLVSEDLAGPDQPRWRIYADTSEGILAHLIAGFSDTATKITEAWLEEDSADYSRWFTDAFLRCRAHAHQVRQTLQGAINTAARADGSWSRLTADEQAQCEGGAAGMIPTGLTDERLGVDADGNMIELEVAVWSTPHVKLVINRGDYGTLGGVFDDDTELFVPEPMSDSASAVIDGMEVVYVTDVPNNMVILDPSTVDLYVDSLAQAGLVQITVYRPDQPDSLYLDSVRLGRAIDDGTFTEGGTATFADLDSLFSDSDDSEQQSDDPWQTHDGHTHGDGHHHHDHDHGDGGHNHHHHSE